MAEEGVLTTKRSRANTRARLLDGAYEVFADRGFQAATVEDVCDAAGFTRGAFYSNFTSLDQLFLALWDRQAERIVAGLGELLAELQDDQQGADRVSELLANFQPYDRRWFLVNTEFLLYALRHPDAAEALARHRGWLRAELARVLDLLPDIDARRLPVGVDRDLHTRMVIAAFEGCQAQTLVEPALAESGVMQQSMLQLLVAERASASGPPKGG